MTTEKFELEDKEMEDVKAFYEFNKDQIKLSFKIVENVDIDTFEQFIGVMALTAIDNFIEFTNERYRRNGNVKKKL